MDYGGERDPDPYDCLDARKSLGDPCQRNDYQ